MSEESRRFRLGVFVLGGIALAIGGIVALSAGRLFQDTYPVYCYFEENVQGLEPGSAVKFRGVEIGRVEEVSLMPSARIASKRGGSHEDSYIEVRSSLLLTQITTQRGGDSPAEVDAAIRREVSNGLRG